VSLGEGTGATMSDDEDELQMDFSLDQSSAEGHDMMGFGPLLPTESERSLMERVRQELKIELKQVILVLNIYTCYLFLQFTCSFTIFRKFESPTSFSFCRVSSQELKMSGRKY